jgi:hypothetical protein
MVNTNVPKIELKDDDSIELTVQVVGFEPGEPVEISGHATQDNGAFASFYAVQPSVDPDGATVLTVAAVPTQKFVAGQAITTVSRAAYVWVTVLQEDKAQQSQGIQAAWKAEDDSPAAGGSSP